MDALIFDVDGTLWDSRIPVGEAWNAVIEQETGAPVDLSPARLSSLFGKTVREITDEVLPHLTRERRDAVALACFDYENKYLEEHPGTLYPGVAETLAILAQRWPLYVVSNCQSGYIDVFLRSTGLTPCIRGHLCHGDTGRSKGETLRMLMKREGLSSPVYVGDTQGDAHACAQAGIPMVWASYGFGKVKGPWRMISAFDQLTELLHEL
ncbi:MAG: HAD family hydrolase [Oscillospiraceae bacterium]|nr:HAD family hydrolase [Oscillospiraceae bacterium]